MAALTRWWSADCAYPGKDKFIFGSVVHVQAETTEEAHRIARHELAAEWARISPHPAPEIVNLIPGRIILMLHEDAC